MEEYQVTLDSIDIELIKRALIRLSIHYHELAEDEFDNINNGADVYMLEAREVMRMWFRFYDLMNEE